MAWTAPRTWVSGELTTAAQFNAHVRDNQLFLKDYAWPVGSVYYSTVSTNPNTLFGFGTWVAFSAGRAPVGIDTLQAEFDTLEETGGSKMHTLTSAEMPSHTHVQDAHGHGVTDPGHVHQQRMQQKAVDDGLVTDGFNDVSVFNGANTASATTGITLGSTTPTNQSTGGGGAHTNLQPYIVVYMWKRTA